MTETQAARRRFQPAADVLSGETADIYFERARKILAAEHLDPVVTMEIFPREDAVLCGAEESLAYLREILGNGKRFDHEPVVESLSDGDLVSRKEVVMRIHARYSAFGLYETAILGIFAQGTGWATAARRIVEAAAPIPVIGFGARHVHPSVADQMDYASVVGGCIGASTPAGARLAGLSPTGTMPHALILIFGDTVRAVEAFDRHIEPEVPRIALVDTFKDEAEESVRVADALGERLWGVRLDTPSERGRVTADLVKEVRARLDMAGHGHVKIVVSGGLDVERIAYFKDAGAPVDS
ncbi:MAG TPA: nicotinate phosphoribosyltransferase, partial [Candidatus Limnocylindria bacterium]